VLSASLSSSASQTPGVSISWREGVYIESAEGPGVWCDAAHRRELCFVSSAQVLKALRLPDSLLCSERSFRLYAGLHDAAKTPGSALLSPTGRPFQLGALRLELFPSGAMPGSASLWLRSAGGVEVVYAGAPNPAQRTTADPMQVRAAQHLIIHAPLATTDAVLPSREQALLDLRARLAEAQRDGQACVILCPALSTAPELIHALRSEVADSHADPPRLLLAHAQILLACTAYRRVGALPDHLPMSAPPLRRFAGALPPGSTLFWPIGASLEPLASLRVARTPLVLLCSAVALLPAVLSVLQAQLAGQGLAVAQPVPFPDALDRAGLVRYVRDTGCRHVYLTAGACVDLADELAPASCEALGPPSQLRLF